jgi:N-acetylneuraminate synthase
VATYEAREHPIMTSTWLREPRPGSACSVVAEVSQSHDGSLGMAHAFIDAAAEAGADAIKFQTHIASAEGTTDEPWRTRFSPQDETRFDYWRRMEFTPEQWHGLKAHADKRGLHFLSSPFSMAAVELLSRVGVAAWKVASGEINNDPLLDAMAASGLPMMLSTGMSPVAEIDAAVERVRGHGVPFAVLQCTSIYPCPPELVGFNLIPEFRERYGCAVGLSDHSATIYPGLAAATLGIEVLEVHITLSREMFGPDVVASITTGELRQLVEGVRFIEGMRATPCDKEALPDAVTSLRDIFMKSVVAADDLEAGTVLRLEHLTTKKPGTGIPARECHTLVGRRLRRSVAHDALLSMDDLEEVR